MNEGEYKGDVIVSIPIRVHRVGEGDSPAMIPIRVVDCETELEAVARVKRALEFLVNNSHEIEGLL